MPHRPIADSRDPYRRIADSIAAEIAAGRLAPGERLPPQRVFAYRHGIATSTASRVYAELIRRGLTVGEVGRGTYVRSGMPPSAALIEPAVASVDLEQNFPTVPEQGALIADALSRLLRRPPHRAAALRPVGAQGTAEARVAGAALLARPGWKPTAASLLFAGNGKQAIAAALAALVPPGGRLGVEALTYPVVKSLAAHLGISLVPLAMDAHGLDPHALAEAHRAAPLRAVYLQPTLHNPTGATMPAARRSEIAALLRRLDLVAVEDAVYAFLIDAPPPLAASAPERVVVVDSLSKRLSPGLTIGMLAAPEPLADRLAASLRAGVWLASGIALAAGTALIADGTVATVVALKRRDAAARQAMARGRLVGLDLAGDPSSYHLWLTLPAGWRAEAFVAAAARRGIAITPASVFAAAPGHAPNAVRLALATPEPATLEVALTTLARLALEPAEAWQTE